MGYNCGILEWAASYIVGHITSGFKALQPSVIPNKQFEAENAPMFFFLYSVFILWLSCWFTYVMSKEHDK